MPTKFDDPERTAAGQPRARVPFRRLRTLWFNTGTLCNLACVNCYIESSPSNDRLAYLTRAEVAAYLDEIESRGLGTEEIGFTGGEPFMNPDFLAMLEDALERGFRVLVLTNAMRPMMKREARLGELCARFRAQLEIRVSLDHHTPEGHEALRGGRSWQPTIAGLRWLAGQACVLSVAGRTIWDEPEALARAAYGERFGSLGVEIDANDPARLVLFPEMDETASVPEISTGCWEILGKQAADMMCATSRMVVKHRGASDPVVVACTLLPYDERFRLAKRLTEARSEIAMNHPHCARFCALGGGACSTQ